MVNAQGGAVVFKQMLCFGGAFKHASKHFCPTNDIAFVTPPFWKASASPGRVGAHDIDIAAQAADKIG